MQPPNHYINELEHWRHTSHRPQRYDSPKHSPLQSPSLSPTTAAPKDPPPHDVENSLEVDHDSKATSKAFTVETPRGWLEYAPSAPSASYSTERKKTTHQTAGLHKNTADGNTVGTMGTSTSTSSSGNNQHHHQTHRPLDTQRHAIAATATADSQTARDMLGAVSYEDIVKLTQMTTHLPNTSLSSKYPSHRTHQRQRSEDPSQRIKHHHTRSKSMARPPVGDHLLFEDTAAAAAAAAARQKPHRLRMDPEASASTENLTSSDDRLAMPIVTRSSLSTPPPSSQQQLSNARAAAAKSFDPHKGERRRSWYKQLVRRDKKGKGKDVGDLLRSSISAETSPSASIDTPGSSMLRDGSHSSTGSGGDIRQLMFLSQTESSSSTPSIVTDPELLPPPEGTTRKRSSLHPTSLMKGRFASAWTASSADAKHKSPAVKASSSSPPPGLQRRHSFDSIHSSAAYDDDHGDQHAQQQRRRRRRSSVDPSVVSLSGHQPAVPVAAAAVANNNSSSLSEAEKTAAPLGKTRQIDVLSEQRSRSPEALSVHDIRSSFDLYGPPLRDKDAIRSSTDDMDSYRFYPSGSEDGIKSGRASLSDYGGAASAQSPVLSDDAAGSSCHGSLVPVPPEEITKTLMFDYDSLPDEVHGLLKEYEKFGKLEIVERRVRYIRADDNVEDDAEDEDDLIDASQLAGGPPPIYDKLVGDGQSESESTLTRKIAIVRASKSDNAEFVKLIHLTDGRSISNGYLLDLHVSMMADSDDTSDDETPSDDLHMLIKNMDTRIEELKELTQISKEFMDENRKTIEALAIDDSERSSMDGSSWQSPANSRQTSTRSIQSIKEAAMSQAVENKQTRPKNPKRGMFLAGPPSASSSSSSLGASSTNSAPALTRSSRQLSFSSSIRRAPSLRLDTHLPYRSMNPFDYRQEEVQLGVCALENEMSEFKRALYETEELIRDIQIDISDTRQKMASYIKDMPDTHYSALKKLEVEIESILANRAKNPWLDTGYALLSYLLTLCALLVWIIICALKWGRTVILFPRKLWRTYNEYLLERNKAVKQASLRTVSSGTELSSALRSPARPRHRHQDI